MPDVQREDDTPPSFDWAESGAMSLTGTASGPPRLAAGPLASAARAAGRAIALRSGRALHHARDWPALLGERAALAGLSRAGRNSCGGQARLLETRDAWIALQLPREDDWRLIPAWLEAPETSRCFAEAAGPTPAAPPGTEASSDRWATLATMLRSRRSRDLIERGRLMGLAVARARRDPDSTADGPLFRIEGGRSVVPGSRRAPLRVLDLSTLWAGPLFTSILVECGMDVLKVEGPMRPDGARNGPAAFFHLLNAGKDGAALDLKAREDRRRFEALLESADVVVESARPRAMTQLGYPASDWVEEQPGRLWVSITGYGREHEWIAFGDDAAVAAGLAWPPASAPRMGAFDAGPCFCADAVADPLTGLHAAALTLAHLEAGRGGLLSLSLRDVAADCAGGGIEADARVVPEGSGWAVELEHGGRKPVRAARARVATAAPPQLQPLTQATFTRWTGRRC